MNHLMIRGADMGDAVNAFIARAAQWLTLFMVLVQFCVVILRYVFGIGSIQMQESIIYMHGVLFMMAAAATLRQNQHVRVDIFYAQFSPPQQNRINLLGHLLFLLPFAGLVAYASYDYVAISWAVKEGSRETSGIQAIYLLKTVIMIFAAQLSLQAISGVLRILSGDKRD